MFRFIERIERVSFRQAKAIVAEHAGIALSGRAWTSEDRRAYVERRILIAQSDAFWKQVTREYSEQAASIYSLDRAACKWMLEHQDDPGLDDSVGGRLCWVIFRLVPHADYLESNMAIIREASPERLREVYSSYRDQVPSELKQQWAEDREIEADITAYIVAQLAIAEIGRSSAEAA